LAYYPQNNYHQTAPFQLEQLIGISNEKGYPIILQTSVVIRFPKAQLGMIELVDLKLPEFRRDQAKLQQSLEEINRKLMISAQPIEDEAKRIAEKIAEYAGIRSKKWQKILLESQRKLEEAKIRLQKGVSEHKVAEEMAEDLIDEFNQIQPLMKKLELFLVEEARVNCLKPSSLS
jgi:hypothetical protein